MPEAQERRSPDGVPKSCYFDRYCGIVDLIHDAIPRVDDFAQRFHLELWHDSTDARKLVQPSQLCDERMLPLAGCRAQYNRRFRPNRGPRSATGLPRTHTSIFFSTSSSGTTSSWEISSRPSRIPAINSIRFPDVCESRLVRQFLNRIEDERLCGQGAQFTAEEAIWSTVMDRVHKKGAACAAPFRILTGCRGT